MKRNLVVIRFGTAHPLPKEVKFVLDRVVAPEDAALAMARPFYSCGVVSIFRTSLTAKELAAAFAELAESTSDRLPVIVMELDDPGVGLHIDTPEFSDLVKEYRALLKTPETPTVKIEMNLDQLLDLANRRGGVDKLTADERQLLEKLAKDF